MRISRKDSFSKFHYIHELKHKQNKYYKEEYQNMNNLKNQ